MKTMLLAALLSAALAAPVAADRADEDLAAVKKAVAAAPAAPAPHRSSEAKWFRVRVVEKGAKHGRVSINLPLGLVRAFGEDWPLQGCRRGEGHQAPTLGEVLKALDSGQNLVEIDDEDASVRVWVD